MNKEPSGDPGDLLFPSELSLRKQKFVKAILSPTNALHWQVSRAVLASVAAAAVDFGTLILLVEYGRLQAEAAAVVSYLVGGVVNYFLCARWVFPSAPSSVPVGFMSFTLLSLVGLAITWACMRLCHGHWGLHYSIAKIIALGFAFGWNFLSRKLWIFR